MSRADLDALQAQLKGAIQSHQMLVSKMKLDPQNANLLKQRHELQTKITILSEKQKIIVQNLRKELVNKQAHTIQQSPVPLVNNNNLQMRPSLAAVPHAFLGFPQPTDLSMRVPVKPPVSVEAATVTTTTNNVCVKTPMINAQNNKNNNSAAHSRGPSPPIRVPQYPLNRPQLLQNNKSLPVTKPHVVPANNTALKKEVPDAEPVKEHRREEHRREEHRRPAEKRSITWEERKKIEFMAALDLITQETYKELQSRRTERKRRSTANPQFSYNFEPERKRLTNYLVNTLPLNIKRPRGRPPKHGSSPNGSPPNTPDSMDSMSSNRNGFVRNGAMCDIREDHCARCMKSGDVVICDACDMVYHLGCLEIPEHNIPAGMWTCPKCQTLNRQMCSYPETLTVVHSYIANKAAKEEERKKLQKKNSDLSEENQQMELKSKQLNEALGQHIRKQQNLVTLSDSRKQSVEKLKNFIKVFQTS